VGGGRECDAGTTGTVTNEGTSGMLLRFRASAYTSGTISAALGDSADLVRDFTNRAGESSVRVMDNGIAVTGGAKAGGGTVVLRGGTPVPAGLPDLPITLKAVYGPGNVVIDPTSAVDAAIIYYAPTGARDCTVGTGGTDTTSGSNKNFATITYFMRTDTLCSVARATSNITEVPFDLRSTDASQSGSAKLKAFYANGFTVTIRSTGPDPTAATWTADGTLTHIYSAGASWLSSSAAVTRVLRTDQNDLWGYYKPFVQYTSKALLAAATTTNGWYWDDAAKQLWLHLPSDANVESNKSILKVMYVDTNGSSRIQVAGAPLALDGVRMEGVQFLSVDQNSRRPSIWTNNITQLWATAKGWDGTQAGDFIETNSICYASAQDCRNASAPSSTGKGLILTANSRYINAGDMHTFAEDGTIQGVSAHGGSHHVSFGSQFIGNNGQGVADTTTAGISSDVTWLVGTIVGPQQSTIALGNIFCGTSATGSRAFYLDTVRSIKAGIADDLQISLGCTAYSYGTTLGTVTGGSTQPFDPALPGLKTNAISLDRFMPEQMRDSQAA
jgi:hypothetical protein